MNVGSFSSYSPVLQSRLVPTTISLSRFESTAIDDGRNFGIKHLVRDSKQRQLVADVLFHHARLSSINKM